MPIDPNLIFWIVFIAVIMIFLLDQISEFLNLKALVPKVPEEFSNVFDDEKYAQSLKYTKVTTKFGFADSTFNLLVFLLYQYPLLYCMDIFLKKINLKKIVFNSIIRNQE